MNIITPIITAMTITTNRIAPVIKAPANVVKTDPIVLIALFAIEVISVPTVTVVYAVTISYY